MDLGSFEFAGFFGGIGFGLGALAAYLIKKNSAKGDWAILLVPIGMIAGIAVGEALFSLKGPIYDDTIKPIFEKGKINTQLTLAAASVNADTPQMVDEVTRLDRVVAGNRRMQYIYTLVGTAKADLDIDKFVQLMRPHIVTNLCTGKDMAFFLDNDVLLQYTYRDETGLEVATIEARSADCR